MRYLSPMLVTKEPNLQVPFYSFSVMIARIEIANAAVTYLMSILHCLDQRLKAREEVRNQIKSLPSIQLHYTGTFDS